MSEIRQPPPNKDNVRRQNVNFANAAGDVDTKKNSTHHKSRNNIPKSLRYDLENALVGLCDVWFEEIKPYLVRNNIKLHGDAGGDLMRSPASTDCSHIDPGRSNHHQRLHANYVDSFSTRLTASKAPCHKPQLQQLPLVLTENPITMQNQLHNSKKETVRKPRKRRKCQAQIQPRQLIPRLCRTTSTHKHTEVYLGIDSTLKISMRNKTKFSELKRKLQTKVASTQTEESMKGVTYKLVSNINPKLTKFVQRPATTTITLPKKNKHHMDSPLFKGDLVNIIAEKHDKMLKVLYTSPRKEEYPSVMNLFSPSEERRKTRVCNRKLPWK